MNTAQLIIPADLGASERPTSGAPRARIRFRQPVSEVGYIDAAWWPRSLELAVELPPLLEVLWTASRDINRVRYNISDWQPAPRTMLIDGHSVRLGGFRTGVRHVISLSDGWRRERIDVLVIAPNTEPRIAQQTMTMASEADNTYRPEQILTRAGLDQGGASGAA